VAAPDAATIVRLALVAAVTATLVGAIAAADITFELAGDPSTPEFRASDALNHCLARTHATGAQAALRCLASWPGHKQG
jgi:hypothetical protein